MKSQSNRTKNQTRNENAKSRKDRKKRKRRNQKRLTRHPHWMTGLLLETATGGMAPEGAQQRHLEDGISSATGEESPKKSNAKRNVKSDTPVTTEEFEVKFASKESDFPLEPPTKSAPTPPAAFKDASTKPSTSPDDAKRSENQRKWSQGPHPSASRGSGRLADASARTRFRQ